MKNILFAVLLLNLSCNKEHTPGTSLESMDSAIVSDGNLVEKNSDSSAITNINTSDISDIPKQEPGIRSIDGDKIIKTITADLLPLDIEDELTANHQQMIIKIKNFKGTKISGTVTSLKPGLNIRFNQIRLANGEYDGPFGGEINYDIKDKGEIWLIIGENLMATTETTGKFKVSLN